MSEKTVITVRLDDDETMQMEHIMERENCDRVTAIRHALSVASQPRKPAPVNVSDGIKTEDILLIKNMLSGITKTVGATHDLNNKTAAYLTAKLDTIERRVVFAAEAAIIYAERDGLGDNLADEVTIAFAQIDAAKGA